MNKSIVLGFVSCLAIFGLVACANEAATADTTSTAATTTASAGAGGQGTTSTTSTSTTATTTGNTGGAGGGKVNSDAGNGGAGGHGGSATTSSEPGKGGNGGAGPDVCNPGVGAHQLRVQAHGVGVNQFSLNGALVVPQKGMTTKPDNEIKWDGPFATGLCIANNGADLDCTLDAPVGWVYEYQLDVYRDGKNLGPGESAIAWSCSKPAAFPNVGKGEWIKYSYDGVEFVPAQIKSASNPDDGAWNCLSIPATCGW